MAQLFIDRLIEQIQQKNTPCIVGLDPALDRMPQSWLKKQGITESGLAEKAEAIYQYNLMVLDAIADLVPAVKPQSAYYELFGSAGIVALEKDYSSSTRSRFIGSFRCQTRGYCLYRYRLCSKLFIKRTSASFRSRRDYYRSPI